jgi:hypothetical protein
MKRSRLLLVAASASMLACTTVTVRPVDQCHNPPGVRYSLPKPVLQVTPSQDGSVTVDVLFLPDPNATYAIDSQTSLAAASLDVAVSRGLLTRVGSAMDTSAVAADAVRAAGTVAADSLKQEAAEAKARQDIVVAAQTPLDKAELDLRLAEAKLRDLLRSGAPAGDIAAQQRAVEDLTIKRDAAQEVLDRERTRALVVVPNPGTFTASTQGAGFTVEKLTPTTGGGAAATMLEKTIGGAGEKSAYGATLLAVDEGVVFADGCERPTVRLRPIEIARFGILKTPASPCDVPAFDATTSISSQPKFETTSRPAKPTGPSKPTRNWTGTWPVVQNTAGVGSFDIRTGSPISSLKPPFKLEPASQPEPSVVLMDDNKVLLISVNGMKAGKYKLTVPFTFKGPTGDELETEWEVEFTVTPSKP